MRPERLYFSLDVYAIAAGISFCNFNLCKEMYGKGLYR
jgi:hypothetical protein